MSQEAATAAVVPKPATQATGSPPSPAAAVERLREGGGHGASDIAKAVNGIGLDAPPAAAAAGGAEEAGGAAASAAHGEGSANPLVALPTSRAGLVAPDERGLKALLYDLQCQLKEGRGEAIYGVGLGAEGETHGLTEEQMGQSVATLTQLAAQCGADVSLIRKRSEEAGVAAEYLVRERCREDDFIEVRVAVVGNVDAGKSTLLGVLTHDSLDNGRGSCRRLIFRHKHEAESGRTSSVAHDILGFDSVGNTTNRPGHDGSLDWTAICTESSKVMTFIDLAGHEKYLKTTVFGLTGHAPHFAMLMVGSNAGLVGMTKEHLGLSLALNVPVFVVVTKIDMCPPNVLASTMKLLQKVLKSPGCRKIPMLVNNEDDVVVTASNFVSERVCPIFQVSNVTGENIHLLRKFLNLLNPRSPLNIDAPAEFQIDETYSVPGVGTVVSGTTLSGTIRVNDPLLLGPDRYGAFRQVVVRGIHRRRMATNEVRGGQTASFALKKIKRSTIRKGMSLLDPSTKPKAIWEFQAGIIVLHHPTTISAKYQAMVHCGSVRQTAAILSMTKEHIRTGDKTLARFRFVKGPEFLRVGDKLVFREGRTKAVGTVTELYYKEEEPEQKRAGGRRLHAKKAPATAVSSSE